MMDIAGPGALLSGAALASMLGATSFGHIWLLRGALCAGGLALASRQRVSAAMASQQLAALSLGSHAFARGGWAGALLEALHLVAAGAWVGGIVALALQKQDVLKSAARFSKPGYAMASITPAAGPAVLALIDGAVVPKLGTEHGVLAAVKLGPSFSSVGARCGKPLLRAAKRKHCRASRRHCH
jgi:putative copper export protein